MRNIWIVSFTILVLLTWCTLFQNSTERETNSEDQWRISIFTLSAQKPLVSAEIQSLQETNGKKKQQITNDSYRKLERKLSDIYLAKPLWSDELKALDKELVEIVSQRSQIRESKKLQEVIIKREIAMKKLKESPEYLEYLKQNEEKIQTLQSAMATIENDSTTK